MTTTSRQATTRRPPEPAGILRWIFRHGTQALTCEIRVNGHHAHDVCLVPHWDVSSSVVERYERPVGALRRHAEIAWSLRQAGWTLLREAADSRRGAAA